MDNETAEQIEVSFATLERRFERLIENLRDDVERLKDRVDALERLERRR